VHLYTKMKMLFNNIRDISTTIDVPITSAVQTCAANAQHHVRSYVVTWINIRSSNIQHVKCQNVFFIARTTTSFRGVFVSVTIER
jgi:hypothetical protein